VERRKWTVWTSISTLALAVIVAASVVGAATIPLKNTIAGAGCEDLGEYLFILNGLASSADAPATIEVTLSCGGSITVAQSKVNNKNVHYSLDADDLAPGCVPTNAYAVVPDSFRGNFVISHVPCGSPSPSPSPSPAPSPSPSPEPSPSPSPSPSPGL
jgi:hypothetical protein